MQPNRAKLAVVDLEGLVKVQLSSAREAPFFHAAVLLEWMASSLFALSSVFFNTGLLAGLSIGQIRRLLQEQTDDANAPSVLMCCSHKIARDLSKLRRIASALMCGCTSCRSQSRFGRHGKTFASRLGSLARAVSAANTRLKAAHEACPARRTLSMLRARCSPKLCRAVWTPPG